MKIGAKTRITVIKQILVEVRSRKEPFLYWSVLEARVARIKDLFERDSWKSQE
jgi:hypothetical protein